VATTREQITTAMAGWQNPAEGGERWVCDPSGPDERIMSHATVLRALARLRGNFRKLTLSLAPDSFTTEGDSVAF
jgi:hypothetical protein